MQNTQYMQKIRKRYPDYDMQNMQDTVRVRLGYTNLTRPGIIMMMHFKLSRQRIRKLE